MRNPVILLDEIDRVSDDAREIMGVLIELLIQQNSGFTDNYIDYPFNCPKQSLATCNNTEKLRQQYRSFGSDRDESYTDRKDRDYRNYLLPKALEEAGLSKEHVMIEDRARTLCARLI